MNTGMAVQIRNVSKRYGVHTVLRNVSIEVARGHVVSIIGPSGSGKSTLLRCTNWLEVPDEGSVMVAGEPVGRQADSNKPLSPKALANIRSRIGMVFQSFNLWPHMSVEENIMVGPIYIKRKTRQQASELAMNFLSRVGLIDKAKEYPHTLSGGQKQRVAIARALAMEPEVMLFDEPTSALDPEAVGEVLGLIRSMSIDGYTMMIVTHEVDFARVVSDRIVFLDNGEVILEDTPGRFFQQCSLPRISRFIEQLR